MSRSIFEEVTDRQKPAALPGGVSAGRGRGRRFLRLWLIVLFLLVVAMIAVGGLTRLTDSGLSITEWAPVTGAIPPLSAEDWQAEFEAYRAIPEYQLQNRGMSLAAFQAIYWWEWGHRQLGRVIGLIWALGFAGLVVARAVPPGWTGRLLLLGVLGGLQGVIGWWMVSSGLAAGMLDVASYRLAVHLGLAFVILGLIIWYVLLLGRDEAALMQARRNGDRRLARLATWVLLLALVQVLFGALVAGIDAGRNYIDWPLMAGGVLPPDMWALDPVWRNLFENDGTVQFTHRIAGYLLFLFGLSVWALARRSALIRTRRAFGGMALMLVAQMGLGILTVMQSAPWHLAIAHQLGAVILMGLVLRARFLSVYPLPQSVRGANA
ncbi:heme A synthase [Rhodophyticola sp. CCM32]|uniref:heme A synthase n=1 Tax=Rhodophyticola sp. CCM32 TaxID=2916397 RepID=UPI00107F84C9|nr:heme A synthase [Rhodophyticola sp. CCM32]QBY00567.1 heme A synthase [Rhodophyticola sp. CCM32]